MKAKILDKSWNVVFVDQAKLDPDNDAECDNPDTPGRQIRFHEDLKGEILLDSVVHEGIHAAAFNLTEPFVEQAATDIAAILWRPSVLRRVLDDPLAKRIALELVHEDYIIAKDQKHSAKPKRDVREDAGEQSHQQGPVQATTGSSEGMEGG